MFAVQILKYSTPGTYKAIATITPTGIFFNDDAVEIRATATGSMIVTPGQPYGLRIDYSTVICEDIGTYQCTSSGQDISFQDLIGNRTIDVAISSEFLLLYACHIYK